MKCSKNFPKVSPEEYAKARDTLHDNEMPPLMTFQEQAEQIRQLKDERDYWKNKVKELCKEKPSDYKGYKRIKK